MEHLNRQPEQPNRTPHVSVVMPVYNGAHTLIEAVNSVLKQTYNDLELIICNDASTDETANLLNNITDDRVRVIHNSHNLGQGPSRDRAIDLARGVWIAIIDADDAWAPERLGVLLGEAGSSSDRMLFDDIYECHDTPSGMVPWRVMRGRRAFGGNGIDAVQVPTAHFVRERRLLIKPLFPAGYVKEYRISHGFRQFAEDTEFFLKLLAHGLTIRYVPRAMYYYRITPGSMTAQTNRFILMREVLEGAIGDFEHAPDVQAALCKKISQVVRSGHYVAFALAKQRKDVPEALRIVCECPWVVPDHFGHLLRTLFYSMHRARYGGRKRGMR